MLCDDAIKAAYAGWKYHLAVQGALDMFERDLEDTPHNSDLIQSYYDQWVNLTEKVIQEHGGDENETT